MNKLEWKIQRPSREINQFQRKLYVFKQHNRVWYYGVEKIRIPQME